MPVRVVHYINQFFGQIGGEEAAGTPPRALAEPIGPARLLTTLLGEAGAVVGTVICGDNYFNEQPDQARTEVLALIRGFAPDVVVAGPAFNAGRYGIACGEVCKAVQAELGIPAVTGMYPEQTAAEMYRKAVPVVKTSELAAGMRPALERMALLALKSGRGEALPTPAEAGYLPRGIRKNAFTDRTAAERAVDMALDRLLGRPFKTEVPLPTFMPVPPSPPVLDLSKATVALITTAGVVPTGNPDGLRSFASTNYGRYSVANAAHLSGGDYYANHGGFYTAYCNADPDLYVPVDAMRDLEASGAVGRLYPWFFSTAGPGTYLENGRRMGREIAAELVRDGVHAAIITST